MPQMPALTAGAADAGICFRHRPRRFRAEGRQTVASVTAVYGATTATRTWPPGRGRTRPVAQ